MWVVVLLSTGSLRRLQSLDPCRWPRVSGVEARPTTSPRFGGRCCGWAWRCSSRSALARWRRRCRTSTMLTPTSWTVLLATVAGLMVARTPLARFQVRAPIASALLALLVAVLARRAISTDSRRRRCSSLCGFSRSRYMSRCLRCGARVPLRSVSVRHFLAGADRRRGGDTRAGGDLFSGARSIAVLLAMLGLILGTGFGLLMASVLSALAPTSGLMRKIRYSVACRPARALRRCPAQPADSCDRGVIGVERRSSRCRTSGSAGADAPARRAR